MIVEKHCLLRYGFVAFGLCYPEEVVWAEYTVT